MNATAVGRGRAREFASYSHGGVYHLSPVMDTGHGRFEVRGLPEMRVH